MSDLQDKRFVIYPYNTKKAEELMDALRMKTATEMVNYLIEVTEAQQLTKITQTDPKTKRTISNIIKPDRYRPRDW